MAEPSGQSIANVGAMELKAACTAVRQAVADQPFDERPAQVLREAVERLVRECPRPSDYAATLPPELAEASRLLSLEEDEPAEIILRQYLSKNRNDVRAMAMMAEVAGRCDLFEDAHRILMRALEIDPNSVDALMTLAKLTNHLAFLRHNQDRGDEALNILERVFELDPTNADAVSLYSSILVRFRRVKEAPPWYERLLNLDPLHWLAWTNYGMLLNSLGEFGKSVAALRTAAAINPNFGLPWWEIANLKISRLFDGDVLQMQAALAQPELSSESRAHIHFALAKAFDQRREYAAAADQLDEGNAIKRDLQVHDPEVIRSDVDDSVRIFVESFFEARRAAGHPSRDPIFIVGMQRAGSTLVEQILASHSQIEGTEELFFLLQLAREISERNPTISWQQGLAGADAATLHDLGAAYLRLSSNYRLSGRPFYIDKNPANWRLSGLIATILPSARIIDVRRNPMDCCFANWTQHYENGVGFSYSQVALGRYYADYIRFMRHLDRVLPGKVHRLIYDDLVDDLESSVRSLLAYLDLPFEESCLRFFETDRAVLTPSAQQVRQPINRSGFGRWRNYEPWLDELKHALADAADSWRD
jgi:tetratricopeptide (TPR) repeat protein